LTFTVITPKNYIIIYLLYMCLLSPTVLQHYIRQTEQWFQRSLHAIKTFCFSHGSMAIFWRPLLLLQYINSEMYVPEVSLSFNRFENGQVFKKKYWTYPSFFSTINAYHCDTYSSWTKLVIHGKQLQESLLHNLHSKCVHVIKLH